MAAELTREEAIKIVQSATVWTDEERNALAMLIPELAESEDEIRKAIIGIIKNSNAIDINVSHERMIAYLEKQKDIEDRWIEDRGQCFWNGVEEGKMLNKVLDSVTYAFYDQGNEGEIEDDPAFLWLHRLRPSWKPSEEQPDFPTTDEQMKEFLATHPKIKVPEKYKNPDWLFKKQEQQEDLDADIEMEWDSFNKHLAKYGEESEDVVWLNWHNFNELAHHFYELGLKAK